MQNIGDLRKELINSFEQVKNGKMDAKKGNSLANTASKIMGTIKLEMTYNNSQGKKKQIKFLETK